MNGFNFESLPIKIKYVGRVDEKEWPHFLYNVTFTYPDGFWTIAYKCGLAHAGKPPSKADIMYSVLADINCATDTFEGFCSNAGYSNDSLKAFDIYRKCQKEVINVRKTFTVEQIEKMWAALEGY